jgi:hypothetical protein
MKPIKKVNRNEFIAWLNGTICQVHNGRAFIINTLKCKEALASLELGEKVILTEDDSHVDFYLYLDRELGGFVEQPIEKLTNEVSQWEI